ncbi:MAG: ferritin family protein [Vulcanibacillus sp.]
MKLIRKALKEASLSAVTEVDLESATDEDLLRIAQSAELSAINLYKTLARHANIPEVEALLLDLAEEEQIHAGELQYALEQIDWTEKELHGEGKEEAEEFFED